MATARALRRHVAPEDSFARDVQELIGYFGEGSDASVIRDIPGVGTHVPVWILGSSLYGAQLAAYLGLPYAFASHFVPAMLGQALEVYRSTFRPTERLEGPHVMMTAGVCAAESDGEATFLRSSQLLAFARLLSGRPGKLPRPTHVVDHDIPSHVIAQVRQAMSCSAIGSVTTVREQLGALIDTFQQDEMIITGMIHDPIARIRSFESATNILADLCDRATVV